MMNPLDWTRYHHRLREPSLPLPLSVWGSMAARRVRSVLDSVRYYAGDEPEQVGRSVICMEEKKAAQSAAELSGETEKGRIADPLPPHERKNAARRNAAH